MRISVQEGSIVEANVDAVIVNLFQGVRRPGGATGAVDRAVGGMISRLIADGEFKGELNEIAVLHVAGGTPFRKVVVVGLGPSEEFSPERVRQVTATSVKAAVKGSGKQVATVVHGAGIGGLDVAEAGQAVAEGALLGTYRYTEYKSDPETEDQKELIIVEMDAKKLEPLRRAVERGVIFAEATNFARDLVNAPANDLTPAALAERARLMADQYGLECTILGPRDMEKLGMGALLGVARGSAQEPRLVVLRHRGAGEGAPGAELLALVGKGVTFDTGGISIKPAAGMSEMKGDMAGAAAVLGAMQAIARLRVDRPVIGVAACVENMPSGTALKPGDILRTMTGKTIEVDNTDAEGRLILADAVAYAESLGASAIIDAATLTGACVIALGKLYTGVVANDDALAEAIIAAGKRTGERYWRLPADPEYEQQFESDVADIKNTGGREAGAITGALIIGKFVKNARWAHLDIAGTAWNGKERHYLPKGGTGVAVRTLADLVSRGE